VHRFERAAEGRAVLRIGAAQPRPQIEQRQIVVAGNRQQRRAQAAHEGAGRGELRGPCALRDVARKHQQIGPQLPRQRLERCHHRRLLGPEVRVRDLKQQAHRAAPSPPAASCCGGGSSR
jgi:hypothetical protein